MAKKDTIKNKIVKKTAKKSSKKKATSKKTTKTRTKNVKITVKKEKKLNITLPKKVIKSEANYEPINLWWAKTSVSNKIQWNYLEHNGLMFTPPYIPHNVPILYKDEEVSLPPEAEEIANFWCAAMDSPFETKEIFINNFWNAFQSKLPSDHKLKGCLFQEVSFQKIKNYIEKQREDLKARRKLMTKEERLAEKTQKEEEEGKYMVALFDWLKEKVGTYKTEPPSLFRGRGEHPKMGLLKRKIYPVEVVLNCHENAPVPRLPEVLAGHCWKDIFHDNTVSWLAYYRDTINGQCKYTFLGTGSAIKGQSDFLKYEKARQLKSSIDHIRKDYFEKMKSTEIVDRQLGTATYMLDVLALRIGNEKDCNEEADTVGCCSLRVEHVIFDKSNNVITLDFLGKDSIRYLNSTKVDPLVFSNLSYFCKNKKPEDDIFSNITTGMLNKYLREFMQGLSAKVFRTYNASITLQNELDKLDPKKLDVSHPDVIKQFYEYANREVAILCNHQRTVPKQHESAMNKMKALLEKYNEDYKELQAYTEHLKSKKSKVFKYETKTSDADAAPRISVIKPGMKPEAIARAMQQLQLRSRSLELKMQMKDENKTVSNTTSRQHYMDPRITVSFCKKWEFPIEKIFNTTLRKKFPWAMYSKTDFRF